MNTSFANLQETTYELIRHYITSSIRAVLCGVDDVGAVKRFD